MSAPSHKGFFAISFPVLQLPAHRHSSMQTLGPIPIEATYTALVPQADCYSLTTKHAVRGCWVSPVIHKKRRKWRNHSSRQIRWFLWRTSPANAMWNVRCSTTGFSVSLFWPYEGDKREEVKAPRRCRHADADQVSKLTVQSKLLEVTFGTVITSMETADVWSTCRPALLPGQSIY